MPARILVVDNDRASQRVSTYALRQEGYEVVTALNADDGLRIARRDHPTLVLIDTALPGVDGFELTRRIRALDGRGHIPIALLAPNNDIQTRTKGLRAGADDSLIRPFDPAELLARVKGLLVRFAPKDGDSAVASAGRVSVFYGARGGAGTTTLLINSAIALQRELERRVVLVDAKLQFGDIRIFLDMGLQLRTVVDVVTATAIDRDLLSKIVVRHDSGVDVLIGPPSPEAAELVTVEHMPQILGVLRSMYDHVMVDIDQRLDETNLQILDAAQTVYVVMTPDLPSLKNVRLLLETMSNLAYDPNKVRLVVNRSTAATGINLRNVETALERPINHKVINDYRHAIAALNSGSPFMVNHPGAALSRSVVEFAKALDGAERPSPAPEPVPAPGPVSRAQRTVPGA